MSVVVRLSIVGKTHQHTFRVVAQDKRTKRDGRFLEILGNVNPHLSDKQVVLKKDRIDFWQKQGAQLSPTVEYLVKNGKLPPRPKKERAKKEAAPTPAAEPAAETQTQEEPKTEETAAAAETQTEPAAEAKPTEEEPVKEVASAEPQEAPAQEQETPTEESKSE